MGQALVLDKTDFASRLKSWLKSEGAATRSSLCRHFQGTLGSIATGVEQIERYLPGSLPDLPEF
jgi:hypothetical protein